MAGFSKPTAARAGAVAARQRSSSSGRAAHQVGHAASTHQHNMPPHLLHTLIGGVVVRRRARVAAQQVGCVGGGVGEGGGGGRKQAESSVSAAAAAAACLPAGRHAWCVQTAVRAEMPAPESVPACCETSALSWTGGRSPPGGSHAGGDDAVGCVAQGGPAVLGKPRVAALGGLEHLRLEAFRGDGGARCVDGAAEAGDRRAARSRSGWTCVDAATGWRRRERQAERQPTEGQRQGSHTTKSGTTRDPCRAQEG